MAGNQTDEGRVVGRDQRCVDRSLPPFLHREGSSGMHKNWRQIDSRAPHGGEPLGATGRTPRLAGKKWEEERALRDIVSSGTRLEPWP
jgi:hypothetical protein